MRFGTILLLVLVGLLVGVVVGRLLGVEIHRRKLEEEFAPGRKLKVVRNVTRAECPWLDHDVPAGLIVWEYLGPTYGLKRYEDLIFVSPNGRVENCLQIP